MLTSIVKPRRKFLPRRLSHSAVMTRLDGIDSVQSVEGKAAREKPRRVSREIPNTTWFSWRRARGPGLWGVEAF